MDFIDKYADIKLEERDALIANLSEKKGTVMIREYLLEKGMEKGMEKAQVNFATKLIHEGFDETTIVRLTDLSLDQVRQLIRKHK